MDRLALYNDLRALQPEAFKEVRALLEFQGVRVEFVNPADAQPTQAQDLIRLCAQDGDAGLELLQEAIEDAKSAASAPAPSGGEPKYTIQAEQVQIIERGDGHQTIVATAPAVEPPPATGEPSPIDPGARGAALEALEHLLRSLFNPNQLRRLVSLGPNGSALADELPGAMASKAELVSAIVDLYARNGLVKRAHFERLVELAPHRETDIRTVAALWERAEMLQR